MPGPNQCDEQSYSNIGIESKTTEYKRKRVRVDDIVAQTANFWASEIPDHRQIGS